MSKDKSTTVRPDIGRVSTPFFVDTSAQTAADWVSKIETVISQGNADLHDVADTWGQCSTAALGGFYAEAHHAATFNIDAAARDTSEHVTRLGSNAAASPDLQTSWGTNVSSKYHSSPTQTFTEQAMHVPGDPGISRYSGMERLIPADQLDEAKKVAAIRIAKELEKSSDAAQRYIETQANLTDRVRSPEGGTSQPLTKEQAEQWAKDAQQGRVRGYNYEESISLQAELKAIAQAAGTAALINVSIQAAPVVIDALVKLLRNPEYSRDALMKDLTCWGRDRAIPLAADTFIKAGLAASLAAADKAGRLPEVLSGAGSSVQAGIAIVAIDSAKQFWAYAHGRCSAEKAVSTVFHSGLRTTASLAGKAVGQAIIPIPMVGAIVGSLVATYVVDKGINSIETSHAIVLLRALDKHFAVHQEVLQGIFTVAANYEQIYRTYSAAIIEQEQIATSGLRVFNQGGEIKVNQETCMTSEQHTIRDLLRRNQLISDIEKGL